MASHSHCSKREKGATCSLLLDLCPPPDSSDSELELSMVRHQPEGLEQLQAQTKFTKKELQSLYRGFKNVSSPHPLGEALAHSCPWPQEGDPGPGRPSQNFHGRANIPEALMGLVFAGEPPGGWGR